ncbi:hypothetical protein VTO58DRAFT_104723 [Aureobasidium pullulans]|nr:hypothetical protein JADG_000475 [Aureobasidium pullulans]
MVVKWTNDKDSFILNHLLTDASIKIDTNVIDAMIATWPESFGDKPTRKAFTEHFSKVRKNNKGLASGTATPTPSTPRGTATKKKTPASKTPSKRKKATITSDSDGEDDDEAPPTKTPAKRKKTVASGSDEDDIDEEIAELGVKVKPEPKDDESPSKKPRRAASAAKYTESDAELSHSSDAEEYKEAENEAEA